MARPVNADARATRARILAAARHLFAEHGLEGASVRKIASEAEVSLATVHHYYGSKAHLYQSCVDSLYADLAQFRRELEPAALAGGDLEALIDWTVRAAYRFTRERSDVLRILMRRILAQGSLDADWQSQYQGPLLDRGTQIVSAVTGLPALRSRLTLQSLLNLIVRYSLSSIGELALFTGLSPEGEEPEEYEERLYSAVEDHLVDLGKQLLLGSAGTPA